MELKININLLTDIEVNERDVRRCSERCQHIEKIQGTYKCTLFDNHEVDTGEDDDIGYGFKRHAKCVALAENKE